MLLWKFSVTWPRQVARLVVVVVKAFFTINWDRTQLMTFQKEEIRYMSFCLELQPRIIRDFIYFTQLKNIHHCVPVWHFGVWKIRLIPGQFAARLDTKKWLENTTYYSLFLVENRSLTWTGSHLAPSFIPLPGPGKGTLAVTSHPYCGLKPERCKFVCVKADLQCPHPRADTLEPLRLSWACRNSGDVDSTGMFTTSLWNQIQAARSAAAPSK